jgi:hypothetical protein
MLGQLLEIASQFDALEATLNSLREIHACDPYAVARIDAAQKQVAEGGQLVRSRIALDEPDPPAPPAMPAEWEGAPTTAK